MVLVLLFEVPLAILYGFVLKTLWNWFVPLVFPAAPHLGIGVAIGLGLVVSYVMPTPKVDEDKTVLEVCGENIMQSIVHAVIYLAFGLVLHAVIR